MRKVDSDGSGMADDERESGGATAGAGAKREFLDALANGLRVLAGFDEARPAVTIHSVADDLGVTRAGARRILLTLQALGYLEQRGRVFAPTAQTLDLGFRYFRSLGLSGSTRPVLLDLARRLKCAVALGVLSGPDVVFVARVEADRAIKLDLRPGDRLPAYAHSIGRLLLAHLPRESLGAHLPAGPLARPGVHAVVSRAELNAELARIRSQGWSFVNSELVGGLFGVAIPVTDLHGEVVAGLNASSIGEPWAEAQMMRSILPPLRQAAKELQAFVHALA